MKKLSLNAKIFAVLSIFIIASVLISILGLNKLAESRTSLDNIVNLNAARIQKVQEMRALFFQHMIYARDILTAETEKRQDDVSELMKENSGKVKVKKDELHGILLPVGKVEILKWYDVYLNYNNNLLEMANLKKQGKQSEANSYLYNVAAKDRAQLTAMLDNFVERNTNLMAEAAQKAEDDYFAARNMMITLSISSILIGLALAFTILRAMGKSIDQVIANLTDNSGNVTGAAQQIASSSEELSQAATEQASSLEETAASIEQMNSMVQKNAENAVRTSELASKSTSSAEKGKVVVGDMIKAINEISVSNNTIMVQVDQSNQKISDIVKVISEIGNKTKVINDIVFQTKLLSFNASVEAARAGEHGKGFAVVAEEVGNLAQMSGNAAKEISTMLEESIQKVEGIVNETKQKVGHLIQDGKNKVEVGAEIAKQCGDVLDEIVDNIGNVSHMANEISTACQEQAQGVQEITKAMNQLDQVTQTNASTSEEAASAAEELASQADSLREVVSVLVMTIKGEGAGAEQAGHHSYRQEKGRAMPAKTSYTAHNVVAMKPQKRSAPAAAPKLKKAVGHEGSVPSENDPRFEDV